MLEHRATALVFHRPGDPSPTGLAVAAHLVLPGAIGLTALRKPQDGVLTVSASRAADLPALDALAGAVRWPVQTWTLKARRSGWVRRDLPALSVLSCAVEGPAWAFRVLLDIDPAVSDQCVTWAHVPYHPRPV